MGTSELQSRLYVRGDECNILALFEEAFGRQLYNPDALGYWKWKYLANPGGPAVIRVATSANKVVGHVAAIPRYMHSGSRILRVAVLVDAMTHPAYRRIGIFRRLATEIGNDLIDSAFDAVVAFPTRALAKRIFGDMGWRDIAPRAIFINPRNILARPSGSGLFARAREHCAPATEIRAITRVTDAIAALWTIGNQCQGPALIRSVEYLNWRYCGIGSRRYRILTAVQHGAPRAAVVATKRRQSGLAMGMILELAHARGEESALEELLRVASRAAPVTACLIQPPLRSLLGALSNSGFRSVPSALAGRSLSLCFDTLGSPDAFPAESCRQSYFTLGDSDAL